VTDSRLPQLLRLNALLHGLLGVLLAASSWNDLYDTLELPRPEPALFAQLGGIAFLGAAYGLGVSAPAADRRGLAAAVGMNLLTALVLVLWLLFRDLDRWGVDALGYTLLVGLAVTLGALGVAEAILARRQATATRVAG
jgi:hypothetical protein